MVANAEDQRRRRRPAGATSYASFAAKLIQSQAKGSVSKLANARNSDARTDAILKSPSALAVNTPTPVETNASKAISAPTKRVRENFLLSKSAMAGNATTAKRTASTLLTPRKK